MIVVSVKPMTTVFLLFLRLGIVLFFAPIEVIRLLPIHGRLLLTLIISLLIAPYCSLKNLPTNDSGLLLAALLEIVNGLILLLSISITFSLFQMAGAWIDAQMGLNALSIINPLEPTQESLSHKLLLMLGTLYFFSTNGLQHSLQGLTSFFSKLPLGNSAFSQDYILLIKQMGHVLSMTLLIAAPVVFFLFLLDIFSCILNRFLPQISTYFLILPVKIMLGLFLLMLCLESANPLLETLFQNCFQTLQKVWS
jgi:flagellar biosynthetic protein FliR